MGPMVSRCCLLAPHSRSGCCRRVDSPDTLDMISASIGPTGEELLAAESTEAAGHGVTAAGADVIAGLVA